MRSVDEIVAYFKEIESKPVSTSTIERKTKFLCYLMDLVKLAEYDHQKRKVFWIVPTDQNLEQPYNYVTKFDPAKTHTPSMEPTSYNNLGLFHSLRSELGFSNKDIENFIHQLPQSKKNRLLKMLLNVMLNQRKPLKPKIRVDNEIEV